MPRIRAAATLLALALASATPIVSHAASVAYWSFDGCSTSDSTGAHPLAANGSPTCVTGAIGTAWTLDGSTQYLDCAGGAGFVPGSGAISVCVWMRRTVPPVKPYALASWYRCGANPACTNADGALWALWDASGHAYWDVRDDGGNDADLTDSTVAIGDGNWHFLVGTLSPAHDVIRLYVDGVLRRSRATSYVTITGSAPVEIGRWFRTGWASPDYYFPGTIDEVRVYDNELDVPTIAWLYALHTASVAPAAATGLALDRMTPNPVRASTLSLSFTTAAAGTVRVSMLDLLGRKVAERAFDALPAGHHELSIDGHGSYPPGVYMVRVTQGVASVSRRVTVLR